MTKKLGKLIGFTGFKGVGKTTLAEAVLDLCETRAYRIGFSDPMMDMLSVLVPRSILVDKSRWNKPLPELQGRTIRHAAQTLGTEWGRDCIGMDLWADRSIDIANRLRERFDLVIIDNVRFHNEFWKIQEMGGVCCDIERAGWKNISDGHPSEMYIPKLKEMCLHKFVVANDPTILGREAVRFLRSILPEMDA